MRTGKQQNAHVLQVYGKLTQQRFFLVSSYIEEITVDFAAIGQTFVEQ